MQHFHKPAHVRALVLMGQIHGEGDHRHGVLLLLVTVADAQGITQAAHSYAIDRDLAVIAFVLSVFQSGHEAGSWKAKTKSPTAG